MTRFFCLLLRVGAFTVLLGLLSRRAGAAEPLDEPSATRLICVAGPAPALARAQRLAGSARVRAAGALPNPSLVVEHQGSLTGASERETVVGVSVSLGIGGKRFLLQEAATERHEQARADAEATVFESALAFREAYANAVSDQARVEVLAQQQVALDGLSATIQALTKGGEAAGYDLLRHQAQSRLHRSSLESAKARALASRAMLEAWTERQVALPSAGGSLASGGLLVSQLSENPTRESPRIRSFLAAARASEAEARAARRRWVPDLDVFAGYRRLTTPSETGHGISLGLAVPLTFFDHGQAEGQGADAERELASAMAEKLRRERRADLKAARLRLEGLLAALEEATRASTDATTVESKARQLYAAGEATIGELLETFRGAEEARLARLALTHELAGARLALMRAAGTMFDAALDQACRDERRGAP